MQKLSLSVAAIAAALVVGAGVGEPAQAQQGGGRQSMEQCVQRVLTRLYKAQAPEQQVGPAIVRECDAQLRSTLAAAIRSGEAGGCTLESCLSIAQSRAAEEATAAYRAQAR